MLFCCNKKLNNFNVWILKDIKGFTARKIFWAECPNCNTLNLILAEKRIVDNKIFIDEHKEKSAIKVLARERKRIVQSLPHIKSDNLTGWVYGKNVQIKNKKGKITQLRQYAKDLKTGKTNLVKTIMTGGK